MKFFSLFTGVGGFEIAIQGANPEAQCVGYSEIEKNACMIMKYRYPEVKNYGDITNINTEELPDFDILCGGFPCQAFSIAGKRMGFNDTRGTLFYEVARLAKIKRPSILLLENVKGLLNHEEGRTFKTIIATLDELGYDAEWQLLNSKYFGVPQNRERVYIIGRLRGTSWRPVFPITRTNRELDESSKRQGELKDLSGGESQWKRIYDIEGLSPTLTKTGSEHAKFMKQSLEESKPRWGDHYKTEEDISPTLMAIGQTDVAKIIVHSTQTRSADRPSLKKNPRAGGSGHISKEEETYCLDTGNTQVIEKDYKIRRLTPTECEFLQGFPRDWTLWGLESFLNTETYCKVYGTNTQTNTIKILSTLQEAINSNERERRRFDESFTFLKNEILQPRLYEKSVQREVERKRFENARELQSEAINCCNRMFVMWKEQESGYSSQRQEQIKQLFIELDSALQKLPYKRASTERQMEQDQHQKKKECEWEIYTLKKISDSQRYARMGNAITTNVARAIMERILND